MSLGNAGGGSGTQVALMAGKVTAVSSTSITLSVSGPLGQGGSMTVAVTSSTTFTGNVKNISQVKVGDEVMAKLSVNGSEMTANSIQDPASIP
jgi:hypothetical protein